MDRFPAKYFTYTTEYPESGTRIQLGRSYQFAVADPAPDQREFTLTLQGMSYAEDAPEGRSMDELEQFYRDHRLAFTFKFDHPIHGELKVRFASPLKIPEGIRRGNGMLPNFSVVLIEQP